MWPTCSDNNFMEFLLSSVTEDSLQQSSNGDMKRLVKETNTNIEAAVLLVMKAKYILPEVHPR